MTKKRPINNREVLSSLLVLGASPESVNAARDAIISILNLHRADAVTISAVQALSGLCSVNNPTIQNCNFTTGPTTE